MYRGFRVFRVVYKGFGVYGFRVYGTQGIWGKGYMGLRV